MMKEKDKDPAFLFYSKDWLEGTADMSKQAKGVLADLLAHHHQKKVLPNDIKKLSRLAGMSESEFMVIWEEELKIKFTPIGDHLINRKLTAVMTERLEKGHRNKIIGTLASIVRLSPETYEKKKKAKEGFSVEDFMTVPDQNLTERLTEWFQSRLKSIEDENANTNTISIKGGTGEIKQFAFPFETSLPSWTLEAVEMNQNTMTGDKNTKWIQQMWGIFILERANDPPIERAMYQSLTDLTKYFLNWIRNKKPGNVKTPDKSKSNGGKSAGAAELADDVLARLAARGQENR